MSGLWVSHPVLACQWAKRTIGTLTLRGHSDPLPGMLVGDDVGSLSKLPGLHCRSLGLSGQPATRPACPLSHLSPGGAQSPRGSGSGQLLGFRSSALWHSACVVTCRVSRVTCRRRWLPPARVGLRIQDDARAVGEAEPGPPGAWPLEPRALALSAATSAAAAAAAWCPLSRDVACPPSPHRRLREGSRALLCQRLPGPRALFTFTWPCSPGDPDSPPLGPPRARRAGLGRSQFSLDSSAMRWVFMVLFGDFFLSLAFTVSCAAKGVF